MSELNEDYIINDEEEREEAIRQLRIELMTGKPAGPPEPVVIEPQYNASAEESLRHELLYGTDIETRTVVEPREPGMTIPREKQGLANEVQANLALFGGGFERGLADVIELPDEAYNLAIDAINYVSPDAISDEYKAKVFSILSKKLRTEALELEHDYAPEGANTVTRKIFASLGYLVPDIVAAGVAGAGSVKLLARFTKVPQFVAHLMGTAAYGYATGGQEKAEAFTILGAMNAPFSKFSKPVQAVAGAIVFGGFTKATQNDRAPGFDAEDAENDVIASTIMGAMFPYITPGGKRKFSEDAAFVHLAAKNWAKKERMLLREPNEIAYLNENLQINESHVGGQSAFFKGEPLDAVRDFQHWVGIKTGKKVEARGDALGEMLGDVMRQGPNGSDLTVDAAHTMGKSFIRAAERANELHKIEQAGLDPSDLYTPIREGEVTVDYQVGDVTYKLRPAEVNRREQLHAKVAQAQALEASLTAKRQKGIMTRVKDTIVGAYEATAGPEIRFEMALNKIKDPQYKQAVLDLYSDMYTGSSTARLYVEDAYKAIKFHEFSEPMVTDFNTYVAATRDLGIGKRHGEQFMLNDRYTMRDSEIRLKELQERYESGQGETSWAELKELGDTYFEHSKRGLQRLYEEGIISKKDLDNMIDIDYMTSKLLREIDAEISHREKGLFAPDIGKSKDIPYLDQSTGAIKSENAMLLLERSLHIIQNKITRDKFYKSLAELAEKYPNNNIADVAKFAYTEIGFEGKEIPRTLQDYAEAQAKKAELKAKKEERKAHEANFQKMLDKATDEKELFNKEALEAVLKGEAPLSPLVFEPKDIPHFLKELFATSKIYILDPPKMLDAVTKLKVKDPDMVSGLYNSWADKILIKDGGMKRVTRTIVHEMIHQADLGRGMLLSKTKEWRKIHKELLDNKEPWADNKLYESLAYTLAEYYAPIGKEVKFPASVEKFVKSIEDLHLDSPKYKAGVTNLLKNENANLKKAMEAAEKEVLRQDRANKRAEKRYERLKKDIADPTKKLTKNALERNRLERMGKNKSGDYVPTEDLQRLKADNASLRANIQWLNEMAFDLKVEAKGRNIKKSERPLVPDGWKAIEYKANGEKKFVLVNNELINAFEAPGGHAQSANTKMGHAVLKTMTGVPITKALAVTYNPFFGIKTAFRDVSYFARTDNNVRSYVQYLTKAAPRYITNFKDIIKEGPRFREYVESGGLTGEAAMMASTGATGARLHSTDMKIGLGKPQVTKGQLTFQKVKQGWTLLNTTAELTARMTHKDFLMKDVGMNAKIATTRTNRLLNFNRKGNAMRWIDDAYAFAGASSQAMDGFVRAGITDPKVFATKMIEYCAVKGSVIAMAYYLGGAHLRSVLDQYGIDKEGDMFVSDAMSRVPLDVKLGNFMLPLPGFVVADENGKKHQGFLKWSDERSPLATALNILMFRTMDDYFGYDYSQDYNDAWLRNLSPIDASRAFPLQAAIQAAFGNVDPRDFDSIYAQHKITVPEQRLQRDTNRIAVGLSEMWNTASPVGEASPVGLERAAYAVGLANNLGTGFVGSLFSQEDYSMNMTTSKAWYDAFKPIAKNFIYFSRADANLSTAQHQIMVDSSVSQAAEINMTKDLLSDVKMGRMTIQDAREKILAQEDAWIGDKAATVKKLMTGFEGWNRYMQLTAELSPDEMRHIPSIDMFSTYSYAGLDAKANWYRTRMDSIPENLEDVFLGIARAYGFSGDRFMHRVKEGFKIGQTFGVND